MSNEKNTAPTGIRAAQEIKAKKENEPKPLWEIDPDFLNPYKQLQPIQTWAKMGDRPALPKEGIVTFSAKQKKGKSLSTYALVIPLLSGKDFDTLRPTERPNLVLVFDMEMSETTLVNRVLRQVQTIGEYGTRFVLCPLKAKSIEERMEIITKKIEKYQPDIAVIDQAAKLAHNINDPVESDTITNKLDKLSIGRAVWVVMHENKSEGDSNMRGHLGTCLSFAAVENYNVDRKGRIFTITAKDARDTDTEDAAAVRFALDEDGRIIDASVIYREAQAQEVERYRGNFRMLFADDATLRSCDLIERIKSQEGLEERSAKTKIAKAKELGAIRKTSGDRNAPYEVTPENELVH